MIKIATSNSGKFYCTQSITHNDELIVYSGNHQIAKINTNLDTITGTSGNTMYNGSTNRLARLTSDDLIELFSLTNKLFKLKLIKVDKFITLL
jgi:hypothetical protein